MGKSNALQVTKNIAAKFRQCCKHLIVYVLLVLLICVQTSESAI